MMKLYLYILIIGFTIATYRAGFKLVSINGLLWVCLAGIWIALISGLGYIVLYGFSLPKVDTQSLIWTSIAALSLVISSYFIILWMQSWFKVATFTPAYAITSAIFIFFIWILFFKDAVAWQNIFWLFLWILAVYFLSIK